MNRKNLMEFGLSALREQIGQGAIYVDSDGNRVNVGPPMPKTRPTGTDVPPHRKLPDVPKRGGPSDLTKLLQIFTRRGKTQ